MVTLSCHAHAQRPRRASKTSERPSHLCGHVPCLQANTPFEQQKLAFAAFPPHCYYHPLPGSSTAFPKVLLSLSPPWLPYNLRNSPLTATVQSLLHQWPFFLLHHLPQITTHPIDDPQAWRTLRLPANVSASAHRLHPRGIIEQSGAPMLNGVKRCAYV